MIFSKFLFINFLFTFIICLILVNISNRYKFFLGNIHQNIQKIHKEFIPRLGGLSLISFFFIFLFNYSFLKEFNLSLYFFYTFIMLLFGFFEDISDSISSINRFFISALIILIFTYIFDYRITQLEFNFFDILLQHKLIASFFLFLCFMGVCHSFNLIDGVNGLCAGLTLLILIFLLYVTYSQDLHILSNILLAFIGSVLGFFILNFPSPKIFLGDSGSYFLGFNTGIIAVIVYNETNSISPWFYALLFCYPIFELIFTYIRRIFFSRTNPFKSDLFHLHSLIFLFYEKNKIFKKTKYNNSFSSFSILFFLFIIFTLSTFLNSNKYFLILLIFIILTFYCLIYYLLYKREKNSDK